ncbi:MAG: sigma-70 family RNA polymerase sigma factor [Deltaproteobacteria bacterium]|nr:sigma-70 family RNA polymerase sigma factor [Deltaproteobacteria bacterium]
MAEKELKSALFFRLYNATQQRIFAYLLMMVHNHTDAEDLLQETASILWERFEQFDKSKSFAAWSVGIARNKALDFLKSKRCSRASFNDSFYNDISKIEELQSANADQRLEALRGCIKKLSLKNQNLLHLRFEKGLTVKKMSQSSGHSADAIYKRLSRIYSALRDCVRHTLVQWETM